MPSPIQNASDFVPVLGYYLPALLQRIPTTLAYDQDLQVPPPLSSSHPLQIFVTDIETHQAYKRGRAVERQDKKDLMAPVSVIETSEEVRKRTHLVLVLTFLFMPDSAFDVPISEHTVPQTH